MKNIIGLFLMFVPLLMVAKGTNNKVDFIEYDLKNGLHVILHQNNSAPNVVIGVKYHVGSKNEDPELTGFAHFFEHLLFHGSENIPQGTFDNYSLKAGGYNNAYTSFDVTNYYQFLPSHEYKLGLWMESERMLHPIITQEGIDNEREVVKEEKRMRYDNKALGNVYNELMCESFESFPYNHSIIGSMEHLNSATIDDFGKFFDKYYVPNNACLVVAGDIDVKDAKKVIEYYFADIPRGKDVIQPKNNEARPGKEVVSEKEIKGIKVPHIAMSYYTNKENTQDAKITTLVSMILSGDASKSMLMKNVAHVDSSTVGRISSSAELYEESGMLWVRADVAKGRTKEEAIAAIETELAKLSTDLYSEVELMKLKNGIKSQYIDMNYDMETLADLLTTHHFIWGSADAYNQTIEDYMKITPQDIQDFAKKYIKTENRKMIIYNPAE